jgi:hypothetical protein
MTDKPDDDKTDDKIYDRATLKPKRTALGGNKGSPSICSPVITRKSNDDDPDGARAWRLRRFRNHLAASGVRSW